MHEAAYFRTISQRSKLVVDLVQFYKPNENEEPVAPVLRAMEEIRKLKAEVILLYTNKESVELLLKQVRECAALVQGVIILFVLKLKGSTEYVTRLNETARCTGSKIQPKQPESRKYTFYGLYFLAPHFFWHLFLFLNLTNSLIVIKFECIDGLQKLCQQRDDHENMRYVYKWIIQREV